ncbi:MAG: GGDEF domain-containing protein [Steroidobacteraceae bacterium]|nr:GGDEF domain-containing protein [Steroidobacteraceae bacterium]
MSTMDPTPTADVLRQAPDGSVVVQGSPLRILYANDTLAALLRMPVPALVGQKLEELEIEAPLDLNATAGCGAMRVQLKRADDSVVGCERWAVLLPDGRLALYYRPLQRVVAGTAIDRANGLATAEHLLETLRRDWSIGQRDGRLITLIRFDVDGCREYREVFGRVATDNVLRQLGRTIAATMRRASDVVARFGDDEFVALGVAMEAASASAFAETILGRIRALAIHHPRSRTGRFMTMSAGVVTAVPPRGQDCELLLEAAQRALERAKHSGGNRVEDGAI